MNAICINNRISLKLTRNYHIPYVCSWRVHCFYSKFWWPSPCPLPFCLSHSLCLLYFYICIFWYASFFSIKLHTKFASYFFNLKTANLCPSFNSFKTNGTWISYTIVCRVRRSNRWTFNFTRIPSSKPLWNSARHKITKVFGVQISAIG